jgi:hypothetical protein
LDILFTGTAQRIQSALIVRTSKMRADARGIFAPQLTVPQRVAPPRPQNARVFEFRANLKTAHFS